MTYEPKQCKEHFKPKQNVGVYIDDDDYEHDWNRGIKNDFPVAMCKYCHALKTDSYNSL